MTQQPSWDDPAAWCLTTTEAHWPEFFPYYTGNGRLGIRVGELVLDWDGDTHEVQTEEGPDFWGRLNPRLLHTLARHAYDGGDQQILPAWNQARLEIGGISYRKENGRHQVRNILDLRTGEVTLRDRWEYHPGQTADVAVRLVIPRSHPCASWWELSLSGLAEPARLRFGLNAAQVAGHYTSTSFHRDNRKLTGTYTTRQQQRTFVQGLAWDGEGWCESSPLEGEHHAWISLQTETAAASITVAHAFHSSTDSPKPEQWVGYDLRDLDPAGRARAAGHSKLQWRRLWVGALGFTHDNARWEHLVRVHQFYLMATLDEDDDRPLGPLGLTRPGWHGSQLWDADFWLFRALLPLWPKLARSIVNFRLATLEAARRNAKADGLRGTFFTTVSTDDGTDLTSHVYHQEIHINAWIARAAWEASGTPPDLTYLRETAWPILSGVADFFVSRATRDEDGNWHLRGVLPPDESVGERPQTPDGTCDDNVLTNIAARTAVGYAIEAARLLGLPAPAEWRQLAGRLVLLPPDADGIIPEYAGYNGHAIKQADLILAFYPWQLEADAETIRRNVEHYHEKTTRGGPLMTGQIEALLLMQQGERERGLRHLFEDYERFIRGPHEILFETPHNSNSIMLTGIGGLLQALIFGWYGASLDEPGKIPRVGDSWKQPKKETARLAAAAN